MEMGMGTAGGWGLGIRMGWGRDWVGNGIETGMGMGTRLGWGLGTRMEWRWDWDGNGDESGMGMGMGTGLGWRPDGDWDELGWGQGGAELLPGSFPFGQEHPHQRRSPAARRGLTEYRQLDGDGGAGEEGPVGPQGQLGVAGDVLPVVPGAGGQQVTDGHAGTALGGTETFRPQSFGTSAQRHRQVPNRSHLHHPARQVTAVTHRHGRHRLQHHPLRQAWEVATAERSTAAPSLRPAPRPPALTVDEDAGAGVDLGVTAAPVARGGAGAPLGDVEEPKALPAAPAGPRVHGQGGLQPQRGVAPQAGAAAAVDGHRAPEGHHGHPRPGPHRERAPGGPCESPHRGQPPPA